MNYAIRLKRLTEHFVTEVVLTADDN